MSLALRNKPVVFYHIFYEDTLQTLTSELEALLHAQAQFFFNICADTPDRFGMIDALQQKFPGCVILCTSNRGKDIGGKLALMQAYLLLNVGATLGLWLHDKKSLQAAASAGWREKLFSIATPMKLTETLQIFEQNATCGIIAQKDCIRTEKLTGPQAGRNSTLLAQLKQTYNIHPPNGKYIAGTMFWVRMKPLETFFKNHPPLRIRATLEAGNVIDNFQSSYTHSFERMLAWVVTSNNYSIIGI